MNEQANAKESISDNLALKRKMAHAEYDEVFQDYLLQKKKNIKKAVKESDLEKEATTLK